MLGRLFTYNAWANKQAVTALGVVDPPERALAAMGHIAGAEWLWSARLRQAPSRLAIWPSLSVDECAAELGQVAVAWDDYLRIVDPDGLGTVISYTNTKGERCANTVSDILHHIILHSAYHRGQIAMLLRQAGHAPPNTDYIHAARTGDLDAVPVAPTRQ